MFKIPSRFITNFDEYDDYEFRFILELFKSKDTTGFYNGNIKGLLYFSNINFRKFKKMENIVVKLNGNIESEYISVNIENLFVKNDLGKYTDYLQIDYDNIKQISNPKLIKYYCFLLYNINMFDCYKQTYKQLNISTGIAETTLIKYNKELLRLGFIYYTNSGDLYDSVNNIVVNSSNFYSLEKSVSEKELENYMKQTKKNFNWSKTEGKTITSNDKRRASQFIRIYSKKDILTREEYDKLTYGLNIYANINKVDYEDEEELINIKTKSLMDRYLKCGLDIEYDTCKSILKGDLSITDIIDKE